MAVVGAFMDSPLVTWVQTFTASREAVDYNDIADGVYLNEVMFQIDHRPSEDAVKRVVKDANGRLHNWQLLLKNVTDFYQEVLQQLIVTELPNILLICQNPTHETSLVEIQKVLLLMLGCAVQSDNKEEFVNVIKHLHLDVQAAIVDHIKQITDSTENVLPYEFLMQFEELGWNAHINVKNLVQERDRYNQELLKLTQERDYFKAEVEGKKGAINPPPSLERYHLSRELKDCNAQIAKLQEEVDEKAKLVSELKSDAEESQTVISKLKFQNLSLSKDAKAMRTYRDEIDMLREKAMKVDKYEKEIHKYKGMLSELDFYKSRVEELREDNSILCESKMRLEETVQSSQKRLDTAMDDLVRAQIKLEEVTTEKEADARQILELQEENSTLTFEKNTMKEGLGRRPYGMRTCVSGDSLNISTSQLNLANNYHPISEELNDSVHSQVSRLELENEELSQELKETKDQLNETLREFEKLKDQSSAHMQDKVQEVESKSQQEQRRSSAVFEQKIVQLEHTNDELSRRLDLLKHHNAELTNQIRPIQETLEKERQRVVILDKQNKDLIREKEQSKQTIERVCESSQIRSEEMNKEIENLVQQIEIMQKNNNWYEKDANPAENADTLTDDYYDFDEIPDYHVDDSQMTSTPVKTKKGKRIHYRDPKFDTPPQSREGSRRRIHYVDPKFGSPPRSSLHGYRSDVDNQSLNSQASETLSIQSCASSCKDGGKLSALDKIKRSLTFKDRKRNSSLQSEASENGKGQSASLTRSYSMRDRGGVRSLNTSLTEASDMTTPLRRSYSVRGDQYNHVESAPIQRTYSVRDKSNRNTFSTPTNQMVSTANQTDGPFRHSYSVREKRDRSRQVQHRDFNQINFERIQDQRHTWSGQNAYDMNQNGHHAKSRHVSVAAGQDYKPMNRDNAQGQTMTSVQNSLSSNHPMHRLQERQAPDGSPTLSTADEKAALSYQDDVFQGADHFLTNINVISSEDIKKYLNSFKDKQSQGQEKMKVFIDKIVVLQDKNQALIGDNSELRKRLNALKFSEERIKHLETANLKVEAENRKLHKIIESLQSALSGKNPYDDREYHYFSNV